MDKCAEIRMCECGEPQRWVADPTFPIEFDPQLNEYHLIHGQSTAIMRYCFWCGGRLSESTRASIFTTPDETEMAEVQKLIANATSIENILHILGPPDETFDWQDVGGEQAVLKWKCLRRYSKRWTTLVLDVLETPNGTVQHLIAGKYRGNAWSTPPWWQFWKKPR